MMDQRLNVSQVNLTPTMQCNLKCRLCGVLVPQYDYRPQMTADEFEDTLTALFQVVNKVGRLQITGGEPLLHPQLEKLLSSCFEYKEHFDEMWLFSNCAVPLRSNILKVLADHKEQVVVHCSDYGVRPDVAAQNQDLLEKAGIKYKYLKYYGENQYCDGWVDNGDFVPHNRTDEENKTVFAACSHVNRGGSWYIRHGQMHWCGRSVRGTELGKVPLRQQDYVDILDPKTTVEEKRQQLKKLMHAKMITACDYCNGYYGTTDEEKRYPAGEQISC